MSTSLSQLRYAVTNCGLKIHPGDQYFGWRRHCREKIFDMNGEFLWMKPPFTESSCDLYLPVLSQDSFTPLRKLLNGLFLHRFLIHWCNFCREIVSHFLPVLWLLHTSVIFSHLNSPFLCMHCFGQLLRSKESESYI